MKIKLPFVLAVVVALIILSISVYAYLPVLTCELQGGKWGKGGFGPETCNLPTSDAGKECTDSGQCEGFCLAKSETSDKGECDEWKMRFGCFSIIQDGVLTGICVD